MLSMLGGQPNPQTFPITQITVTVQAPTETTSKTLSIEGSALDEALQYGGGAGLPSLLTWLAGLQQHYHGRTISTNQSLIVGTGSQDLLYKV